MTVFSKPNMVQWFFYILFIKHASLIFGGIFQKYTISKPGDLGSLKL